MAKMSAGLLLYREVAGGLQVLLVHPGGPFWSRKDEGAWSVPKGEFGDDEDPLQAARREVEEETGLRVLGDALPLQPLKQASGKLVYAWAVRSDFDTTQLKSNTFPLEWPPKSSKTVEFPEVDRAEWFTLDLARRKITKGQTGFLDQLQSLFPGTETTLSSAAPPIASASARKKLDTQSLLFEDDPPPKR